MLCARRATLATCSALVGFSPLRSGQLVGWYWPRPARTWPPAAIAAGASSQIDGPLQATNHSTGTPGITMSIISAYIPTHSASGGRPKGAKSEKKKRRITGGSIQPLSR